MYKRKAITHAEVRKLLTSDIAEVEKVWFNLAFTYALRSCELLCLKRSAIDVENKRIIITRLKGSVSRVYPLVIDVSHFKEIPFKSCRLNSLFKVRTKKILGEEFSPHTFRHGSACYLLDESNDIRMVQEWLGHKNITNTTAYLTMTPKALKKGASFFA